MAALLDAFNLRGRRALVTGGGRGLGNTFSKVLAEAGADLILAGRNTQTLEKAASELSSAHDVDVICCQTDLSDRNSTENLVQESLRRSERIDILVHNAAIPSQEMVEAVSDDQWQEVFEVNLNAAMVLTRGFAGKMKSNNWGRLIYLSSAASILHLPVGHGTYSATKSALHALARSAAVELGPHNITANCLLPGTFWTDMAAKESHDSGTAEGADQMSALGRWGQPDEIAGALLLLASDAGSYISGAEIVVDGGFSIKK